MRRRLNRSIGKWRLHSVIIPICLKACSRPSFSPRRRDPTRCRAGALLEKLNARARRGFPVLVSAPAGFGKTTLVGDWARASGLPYAWLALDEGDNDLLRFWRYVDAALQTIDSRIGETPAPGIVFHAGAGHPANHHGNAQ